MWYILELLESYETLLDSESQEELIEDDLVLFGSCDTDRYWELDWWVEFVDELPVLSDVDTGIVISLSSSYGERELKEEGLYEIEELEDFLLE